MPKAWVCFPSAREEKDSTLHFWREQGYASAVFRDAGTGGVECTLLRIGQYTGYAATQNTLVKQVLDMDPECRFVVCAADDVQPDLNWRADELADKLEAEYGLFCVVQPTADRWGDRDGAYIDRVAGSPWIGREFARRVYGGNGPYWPEYSHMFVDAEIQDVAKLLGVFWQRRELIHYHAHWGRPQPGEIMGHRSRMPAFLEGANSPEHWAKFKALYEDRKRRGFPGHEVLA